MNRDELRLEAEQEGISDGLVNEKTFQPLLVPLAPANTLIEHGSILSAANGRKAVLPVVASAG